MKDYSHLPQGLVSATRSLIGYSSIYTYLKKNLFLLHPTNYTRFRLELLNILPQEFVPQISLIAEIVRKFGLDLFLDSCKFVHNAYMRTTRLKQRISYMFDHYDTVLFVTLTINDENINLPYKYLLLYAKNILRQSSSCYVLNSDCGDKNGRLHFHAVINNDRVDIRQLWKIGFIKVEEVNNSDLDKRKVARYCTKLARHSVKDTAFDIVYSRLPKKGC